ncbi:hypothetical protein HN680_06995 [Candidatus Peregrinibacteria bacterium]|nr:hypothetical protein [Candidatus Peregrinibacteria bacterium]
MKIKKWTQEKLRALTYDRYCELMETQGFDPISLMKFSKPSRGARISTITDNSPSKRFQMLEQKQFAVGDTVKIGEKGGGQIIKINPGVSLTVQTSDGPRTFKALDYIQKIEV